MQTFNEEWGDPAVAQQKANDWLQRHMKTLMRHPRLRGMTQEQIKHQLNKASNGSAMARSQAYAEKVKALRRELIMRGMDSKGGSVNPLLGGVGGLTGGGVGGLTGGTL